MWREADHPRHPAGTSKGGEFSHASGVERDTGRSKESAGQAGPDAGEAVPEYGTAIEGAVSAEAHHFSKEDRKELSSSFFGTGARGAESERLATADPQVRSRIYFYTSGPSGDVQPEASVGIREHRVRLKNLYDPKSDGAAVWRRGTGETREDRLNSSELEVLKAGYDGYVMTGYLNTPRGNPQGVAILLGKRTVPVKSMGMWRPGKTLADKPAPVERIPQVRYPYAGKKT